MNRLRITVLFLALGAAGCWAFSPQVVDLSPAQVAALEAKLGTLDTENLDAWLAGASQALQGQVIALREIEGQFQATMTPAAQEAGETALTSIWSALEKNPTPAGAALGIIFALLGGANVLSRRSSLPTKKGSTDGE